MSEQEGCKPTGTRQSRILEEGRASGRKVLKENQKPILTENQRLEKQILKEDSGKEILAENQRLARRILKENQGQKPKTGAK